MNFLAHIYLSAENDQIKIGNFIADSVKGNSFEHFPDLIQQGIAIHRKIDSYTDQHAQVKISKRRLHERYKHYDGVIIDILYDHFLASNWSDYSDTSLFEYSANFYKLLEDNYSILPPKVQHMLPHMIKGNWLYNYRTFEGIENVLIGMNKRTKSKSQMHLAIHDLHEHYSILKEDFTLFFKDLISYSNKELNRITL